eukprot:Skav234376  [mRNA]  locus=scaffold2071:164305:166340:- [translate_table: standard]
MICPQWLLVPQVMHPEVLRVTPAFCAFQCGAIALREGSVPMSRDGDFFHKSQRSEKIPTFWSHSWHGGHWAKIITLILLYNGRAAIFLSFLSAFVLMPILFASGVLPSLNRGLDPGLIGGQNFSTWSIASGGLVATLAILLWQPSAPVFLDRICISEDNRMKVLAIFSLAGLLKRSDTMLILWDPTWTKRLWCLFELAAFLKSNEVRAAQALIVRPIFMGPISVSVFFTVLAFVLPLTIIPVDASMSHREVILVPLSASLLLGLVVGYFAVSTVRKYFRDLDVMKEQLLSVSIDTTLSSCCEKQHVSSTGTVLMCDRKIVKECVNIWFGSQEAFEDTVRSQVLDILARELNEDIFTTAWVLSVTSPLIWAFVDLSVSFVSSIGDAKSGFRFETLALLLEGFSIWLLAIPSIKNVLILLCKITRRRPKNMCVEVLKNIAALCVVVFPIMQILACYLGSRYVHGRMYGAWTFAGSMVFFSACCWLLAFTLRSLLKRPGW